MSKRIWIILSNEHSAFWRPNMAGYTRILEEAGRYTKEEAEEICKSRHGGNPDINGVYAEVALIAPEAEKHEAKYVNLDVQLDRIYDYIDACLHLKRFSFVNRILLAVYDTIKVNDAIGIDEVLGFLTVTLPAKNKLSLRDDLLQAAIGKWGNKDNLFTGL